MLRNVARQLKLSTRTLLTGQKSSEQRQGIPAITLEEVSEAKKFFPLDKYFVFGHARSGTTLLVRLIRLHPDVHCNYQAHFFTRPPLLESLVDREDVETWLSRPSNRWNQGRDLSPLLLRVTADFIMEREARHLDKSIVGDKSPSSLLHGEAVRLMHKVYPDARLIYIVRDGRDAIVSHRIQSFIDASQHLSEEDLQIKEAFSRDAEPFLRGERSIFTRKGFHRAVEGWNRNVMETDKLGKEIFGGMYFSLRYEDLLKQPWEYLSRLWAFLMANVDATGLKESVVEEMQKNPDAEWQRQKAGDLIEPLEKGKQGSWRELFTTQERKVFKEIAGRTLIEWGYEQKIDW